MYGKPVATSGGQQTVGSDNTVKNSGFCGSDTNEPETDLPSTGESDTIERATPRPLSPTKLLPFMSNPHKNPNDADLEAVRRRLHAVPRPLKKRNSITEPEGPSGPNILKLLYQKTTLAAMETIPMEAVSAAGTYVSEDRTSGTDASSINEGNCIISLKQQSSQSPDDSKAPPPLPPRAPIPDPSSCGFLPPPMEDKEDEKECLSMLAHKDYFPEEFPPYPPPPYPSGGKTEHEVDTLNLQPPEITGQVSVLPVSNGIKFLMIQCA